MEILLIFFSLAYFIGGHQFFLEGVKMLKQIQVFNDQNNFLI